MRLLRRILCWARCRDAGVTLDPNRHTWRCKRCGCDWGALR